MGKKAKKEPAVKEKDKLLKTVGAMKKLIKPPK